MIFEEKDLWSICNIFKYWAMVNALKIFKQVVTRLRLFFGTQLRRH